MRTYLGIAILCSYLLLRPWSGYGEDLKVSPIPPAEESGAIALTNSSREIMERRKRLSPTMGKAKISNFDQIRMEFELARAPELSSFNTDMAVTGQCISKLDPDTFYVSVANLYVVTNAQDEKQVYFLPVTEEKPSQGQDYRALTKNKLVDIHAQRRQLELNQFSRLQDALPTNSPFYNLFQPKLGKALIFSYTPSTGGAVAAGGGKKKEDSDSNIFFRMREHIKGAFMVERICPYYPGCKIQGDNLVDYLNFIDPYGYCYYPEKIAL